ncbi:hypothetical protein LTR50_002759 [Elasticomyces elasticus]|nr:hypothetical protein LTR50_002759 [Elasticomyces elasticus]
MSPTGGGGQMQAVQQTAPPSSTGGAPLSAPPSVIQSNPPQAFETPRRTQTIGRRPEGLHITSLSSQQLDGMGSYASRQPSQQHYGAPQEYLGNAPNIHLQQTTPQASQFSTVPSNLQPGGASRPGPSSAYTAPTTVPTMQAPQLSSNAQQYQPASKSTTLSSHSHSRSSPAGLDQQKYTAFSNTTPSQTPTNSKTFSPRTPSGAASTSPLGLADIRSHDHLEPNDSSAGISLFEASAALTSSNYLAPWATYSYDWCKWPVHGGSGAGKMAVGSYLDEPHNFIQILDTRVSLQEPSQPSAPNYGLDFVKVAEATCAYPVTRILWEPPSSQKQSTDLLATSGDHLRLWSLPPAQTDITNTVTRSSSVNSREPPAQKLQPLALLSNSKTPEHTAPLTSLDWNALSPKLIITSSIDTTCTIWDIPTLTAKTQLIAHDKEVFDVRFCAGSVDVFVSCGADGSVRMFDLRSLEHSTIIYEPAEKNDKDRVPSPPPNSPTKSTHQNLSTAPPLLRLAASPHDAHLLATFAQDSNLIRILDVRQPGTALLELRGHSAALNSVEWSPSRRGMLASGADDSLVLVWDLLNAGNAAPVGGNGALNGSVVPEAGSGVAAKGPAASWRCDYEVGNLSWAPQSPLTSQGGDWLGVCSGRGIWGVKL